jgi:hypothetical protein
MAEASENTFSELPRVEALRQAAQIIKGDRDKQYGGPETNFSNIAKIWSVIFKREFTTEEIAMAMVGVKLARFASDAGFQPDTWIDIAGYAGCGYEVGQELHSNKEVYLNKRKSKMERLTPPWDFDNPLCAEIGTVIFFSADKNDHAVGGVENHYVYAKQICDKCEHKIDCANWAIRNERHGVWGGTTPKERVVIRKKLRIPINEGLQFRIK